MVIIVIDKYIYNNIPPVLSATATRAIHGIGKKETFIIDIGQSKLYVLY
jgi:hypothetical protein